MHRKIIRFTSFATLGCAGAANGSHLALGDEPAPGAHKVDLPAGAVQRLEQRLHADD
jgi:hypothetical protein